MHTPFPSASELAKCGSRTVCGHVPYVSHRRGVAQLGSASALGAEGRGFKSRHPDHRQDPRRIRPDKITFWGVYCLRLLCKLRARMSAVCASLKGRGIRPGLCLAGNSTQQNPQEVSHKETEP